MGRWEIWKALVVPLVVQMDNTAAVSDTTTKYGTNNTEPNDAPYPISRIDTRIFGLLRGKPKGRRIQVQGSWKIKYGAQVRHC
jgi:hypothetical protein